MSREKSKQVAEYLGYNNVKTFYNDLPKHYQQGLKILHMPVGNSIRKVFKAQDVIDYADKLLVDLTACQLFFIVHYNSF